MNRETKTFKTPGGHTVEFYSYLTGKESRELNRKIYETAQFESEEGSDKPKATMKMTALIDAQEHIIRLLVVSINSNKEGVSEVIDNLPASDYNAIVRELDAVTKAAIDPSFLGK